MASAELSDEKALTSSGIESSGYSRVLEAAIALFAAKGFAGTGIREVAAEAGMVSASLYHWFSNKDAVLLTIMERGQKRINACAAAALENLTAPDAKLAALVRTHVAVHAHRKLEARVVDIEIRSLSERGRESILPLRDAYERTWHATLAAGVTEGVFSVPDLRLARLALIQMCSGVGTWYSAEGNSALADICDDFAAMGLSMVSSRHVSKRDLSRLEGPDVHSYLALVKEYYDLA